MRQMLQKQQQCQIQVTFPEIDAQSLTLPGWSRLLPLLKSTCQVTCTVKGPF